MNQEVSDILPEVCVPHGQPDKFSCNNALARQRLSDGSGSELVQRGEAASAAQQVSGSSHEKVEKDQSPKLAGVQIDVDECNLRKDVTEK